MRMMCVCVCACRGCHVVPPHPLRQLHLPAATLPHSGVEEPLLRSNAQWCISVRHLRARALSHSSTRTVRRAAGIH